MVVITVASRKGGSGKSTLTANLAAFADKASRRCLLIDADPQGSLSLWHDLRKSGEPPLRTAVRGVENLVGAAKQAGFEWVFIDTPPQMSGIVNDAIRAATLVVIPARPSVFDLDAVKETIAYARERRKPYAVVLNGAPAKRDGAESPLCTQARDSLESVARTGVVWPDYPPHHLFAGAGRRPGRARVRCGVPGGIRDRPAVQLDRAFGKGDPRRIQGRERHAPQGGVTAAYRHSGPKKSGADKLRRRRLRLRTTWSLRLRPQMTSAAATCSPSLI